MKQKILRQKQYYYLLSIMFNLNQLSHEVLDPPMPESTPVEEKTRLLYLQSFYYGITMYLVISSNLLINVRYLFSLVMCLSYGTIVLINMYLNLDHEELPIHYSSNFLFLFITFVFIYYFNEKDSNLYFLREVNIYSLLNQ